MQQTGENQLKQSKDWPFYKVMKYINVYYEKKNQKRILWVSTVKQTHVFIFYKYFSYISHFPGRLCSSTVYSPLHSNKLIGVSHLSVHYQIHNYEPLFDIYMIFSIFILKSSMTINHFIWGFL